MTQAVTKTDRWTIRPEGSNWGEFGADDELGMMNVITDAMRLEAMKEVKEGKAFALSLPLDYPGGESEDAVRFGPKLFATKLGGTAVFNHNVSPVDVCCDDGVTMCLQYSTQWDSFAHWGRMYDVDGSGTLKPTYYNGWRAGIDTLGADQPGGPKCLKLGIEKMAMTGAQGRGVLVNLVEPFGRGRTLVTNEMLQNVMKAQNVQVKRGDFLLLYTGYGDYLMQSNKSPDEEMMAHKVGSCLEGNDEPLLNWISESGIVAIVSDASAVEQFDTSFQVKSDRGLMPLHDHCLFRRGIHLGEMFWLTDLAEHLWKVKRNAFLFTGPALRLTGAAGSPSTAIATV